MFNLFLRPYVPGFRVKAQKDEPGFNIGENDGAPLETGTRPYLDEVRTQTPPIVTSFTLSSDGLTQSAPPIGFAGIHVEPQDDIPGFNPNESGVPRQRVAWFDGMRPGSATSEYPDTLEPEVLPRDVGEPVQGAVISSEFVRIRDIGAEQHLDYIRQLPIDRIVDDYGIVVPDKTIASRGPVAPHDGQR
jgi:hypothetical protein